PHPPPPPPAPLPTKPTTNLYPGKLAFVDHSLKNPPPPLLGKNTLLIITSDHGEALGDHGELTHGLFAYESTLKIPLLVWKSGVKHRVESAYVRHIDVVPTILSAAGISKPAPLLGDSLFAVRGSRDGYFESLSAAINRGWAPLTGVIHGGEKYIDLPIGELYDLPRDSAEANNLRDERRRDVQEARSILA